MKRYILEKPKNGFERKDFIKVLTKYFNNQAEIDEYIKKMNEPVYLYWDKVKYKKIPKSFNHEEFWQLLKFIRRTHQLTSPIRDESGSFFAWNKSQKFESLLHKFDFRTGGSLFGFVRDFEEIERGQFITRGIMEEAIASSQLEGANTTRRVAKQMLREKRTPRNESEWMILNNYSAMKEIEETYKTQDLTFDMLIELHSLLTKNTIPETDIGRLRKDDDNIIVETNGVIYHVPPKINFVKNELKRLFDFANDRSDESFVHPMIKAIIIHFWIGYLHPFVDGNGRMARALFYWYLLREEYWAISYLPISLRIKSAFAQYRKAYAYAEQDDNDLTYFIDFNLRKIEAALEETERYYLRKKNQNVKMSSKARGLNLNDRQIRLLQYLNGKRDAYTTPTIHSSIYGVTKPTAISDLSTLVKSEFLSKTKKGRKTYYYLTDKGFKLFL
jgi:Fic family protein